MSSFENILIEKRLVPRGKSWDIRMLFLDYLKNKIDGAELLKWEWQELPSDSKSAYLAFRAMKKGKFKIDVGQAGFLFRLLRYLCWFTQDNRTFIRRGSLAYRPITNDPAKVINRPAEELLQLDGGTSQWASAAYLFFWQFGIAKRIENPPPKLQLTYEAAEHWSERRKSGKCWGLRYDEVIMAQAAAIIDVILGGKTSWEPREAEDYCLASVLGKISEEEGRKRFPSAAKHESNRFLEMRKVINVVQSGSTIASRDHRAIQAGAILQIISGLPVKVKNWKEVKKSWPQFPRFVDFLQREIMPSAD